MNVVKFERFIILVHNNNVNKKIEVLHSLNKERDNNLLSYLI